MKKVMLVTLIVLLLSITAYGQSATKSLPTKPGEKVVYQCPDQEQPISITNVKGKDYVMFQGMVKTCLTRDDKDGSQNYKPQEGYFNFGVQINPKGEVFYMKFDEPIGPCKLVEKGKGGYIDSMCISGKK